MLAHALFVQATEADLHTCVAMVLHLPRYPPTPGLPNLHSYLDALRRATLRQKQERAHLHPDAAEHGADGDT